MPAFIVTVLLIVTIVVLAYPFFVRTSSKQRTDEATDELAQRLRRARDRVYEEIRTLQQDRLLNNVSEEEYRTELETARRQAADLMRQQKQIQESMLSIEEAVDEEIRQFIEPDKHVNDQ